MYPITQAAFACILAEDETQKDEAARPPEWRKGTTAKTHAINVFVFTVKRDLYKKPRLIFLCEWIYSYLLTLFRTYRETLI